MMLLCLIGWLTMCLVRMVRWTLIASNVVVHECYVVRRDVQLAPFLPQICSVNFVKSKHKLSAYVALT